MPERKRCGSALASQPVHGLLRRLALQARRQLRAANHDDGDLQRSGSFNLGVGVGTAGILADDTVDSMALEQSDFVFQRERAACNDELVARLRQGQYLIGLIDHAQHKVVRGGLVCKSRQLLAANRQENILEARCKRKGCCSHIRYMYPLIAGLGRPSGTLHRQQWNTKFCTCGNRMAAHLRGKRVGGINHMADLLFHQIGHQAFHATKPANPAGQGGLTASLRGTGIRINGLDTGFMQAGGQEIGIKRAA